MASKKSSLKYAAWKPKSPGKQNRHLCIVASLKNYQPFCYLNFNFTLSAFNNFIGLSTIPFGT